MIAESDTAQSARQHMTRALELVRGQSWRDAQIEFSLAAQEFAASGHAKMALRARFGVANCMSERGNIAGAADLLRFLLTSELVDDSMRVNGEANLAVCLARGGDIDGAEQAWMTCYQAFLEADDLVQAAACLHNAAVAVHERGRHTRALRLVGGARSLLDQVTEPASLVANCDATAGLILSSLGETGPAQHALEQALAVFDVLGLTDDTARCHGNLAVLARRRGDLTGARHHADAAEAAFGNTTSATMQAAMLALDIDLSMAEHNEARAEQLAQFAVAVASSTQNPLEVADAIHNLAVVYSELNRHDLALDEALNAFDVVDDYRYTLSSLRDRHMLTIGRFEPMVLHALDLADQSGTAEQAAELIERARVAGTPQGVADPTSVYGTLADPSAPPAPAGPLAPDLRIPIEQTAILSATDAPAGRRRRRAVEGPTVALMALAEVPQLCSPNFPTRWRWSG